MTVTIMLRGETADADDEAGVGAGVGEAVIGSGVGEAGAGAGVVIGAGFGEAVQLALTPFV